MKKRSVRADYNMRTPAGDVAVTRMILKLLNRVDELDTAVLLIAATRAAMERISLHHEEVWDPEPRKRIFEEAISPIAQVHGYETEVTLYL